MRKPFLLRVFDAANMQRWNDKIRPVDLRELDKQAHKMIIAYVLGKCQEQQNVTGFDWIVLIEGGIFEFLQRLVLTDLKPQLFHRIKKDKVKYRQLNKWVYEQLEPILSTIGDGFCDRFKNYLDGMSKKRMDANVKILGAAHLYATQ